LKTRDPNARKELLKKEQRITSNFSVIAPCIWKFISLC